MYVPTRKCLVGGGGLLPRQFRRYGNVGVDTLLYGCQAREHRFGQSCLLAVRLIEAGVRFVTVTFGGWDTHGGNFRKLKESLLPQLDDGLSALLTTLSAKGLLDSTAVCVTGEFGRTPKVNANAGRDHWPRAMSVLFAGGGVKPGQVIGASDMA